ncbi:MAG TPA: O-antigen ligase family protein [Phenylobacterium sp.]|nr:O-antigen ligase family protein [Phenylobacterium sp.]
MKTRQRPFVLKPYAAELTGWRRALAWAATPILVLICLVGGFFYALTTPYLIPQFAAPLVILGLIVVWALPDFKSAPTGLLGKLFFAFLIAVLLWPNYLAIVPPGLPWITAIRLIGFPLTFILLICISVSPEFRAKLAEVLTSVPYLWKLVVIFICIQVVSIVFSKHVGDSINALVETQVSWTVMFFVACYVFTRPGAAERWAAIMWVSAIILCFIGIEEAREEHVPWAGHIPSFLQVQDEYVSRVLQGARRLGTDEYRVQGTHSTSLGFAEYLALTTPFVIHFMMGKYPPWVKVAAALSIPFIFYTIYKTGARLGMVGFFIAALLYTLCWGVMRWRQVRGSLIGPTVVLAYPAFFCAFIAATFFVQRLHNMVWGGSNTSYSNEGRMDQVAAGMPKIISHPWGYGIGQGAEALDYHNLAGVLTIDTYYLLVALDYGVVGFLVYFAAIIVVIVQCAKYGLVVAPKERERTFLIPLGISLSAFFIIKSIFSQTENHTLQFMMMGMALALIYRIKTQPEVAEDPASVPVAAGSRLRMAGRLAAARSGAQGAIQAGGPRSSRKPARHPERA